MLRLKPLSVVVRRNIWCLPRDLFRGMVSCPHHPAGTGRNKKGLPMKEIIAFFVVVVGIPMVGLGVYIRLAAWLSWVPALTHRFDWLLIAGLEVVLWSGTALAVAVLADAWTGFQFRITG